MSETKVERKKVRYDFTAIQTHDLAIQLAQKTKELQALEEEKNSVASQYSSRIKEIKANANRLSNQVADGWEFRDVDCDVTYHEPEQGKKTYTRRDNGQKIVEAMESHEWTLFTQAEEKTDMDEEDVDFEEAEETDDAPAAGKGKKKAVGKGKKKAGQKLLGAPDSSYDEAELVEE